MLCLLTIWSKELRPNSQDGSRRREKIVHTDSLGIWSISICSKGGPSCARKVIGQCRGWSGIRRGPNQLRAIKTVFFITWFVMNDLPIAWYEIHGFKVRCSMKRIESVDAGKRAYQDDGNRCKNARFRLSGGRRQLVRTEYQLMTLLFRLGTSC